jgi:DNA-binding transcriptional ArsR family regulator
LGEAADFVAGRFGSVGRHCPLETARTLVQAVEGYPYYVQRLALELFEQEAEGDGGAGVGRAMAAMLVGERYVFEGMVRSISRNQLKLLKALAAHPTDGVTSAAFLAESGLSGSSASQALDRLREEDLVERDSAGVWRLVDPIFARWLVDQRY